MARDSGKCQHCEYWSDECKKVNAAHCGGQHQTGETLCWCCKHAVPIDGNGCEWSMYKQPVDGWEVSQMKIFRKNDGTMAYTYRVDKCPKFERG